MYYTLKYSMLDVLPWWWFAGMVGVLLLFLVYLIRWLESLYAALWMPGRLLRLLSKVPETTRKGSEYLDMPQRSRVGGIYEHCITRKVFLGTCWRCDDWLVTAWHVVSNDETDFYMRVKTPQGVDTFVKTGKWYHLTGDIAVSPIPSECCLRKSTMGYFNDPLYVTALSAIESRNASTGTLRHTPDQGVGMIVYDGSTRPGYSGAPYYSGSYVVGMHVGGGSVNYGYAAGWIRARLARLTVAELEGETDLVAKTKESSELDLMKTLLKQARRDQARFVRAGNPDEIEVNINGRYFIIDAEEYDELATEEYLERHFFDEDELDRTSRKRKLHQAKHYTDEFEDAREEQPEEESFLGECSEKDPQGDVMSPPVESDDPTPVMIPSKSPVISTPPPDPQTSPLVFELIQSCGEQSLKDTDPLLTAKLEEQPTGYISRTEHDIALLRTQMAQMQKSTSDTSSSFSTQLAQLASAISLLTARLEPPSDTMASDLQRLREFRNSTTLSGIEYDALRAEFIRLPKEHKINGLPCLELSFEDGVELLKRAARNVKTQRKQQTRRNKKQNQRAMREDIERRQEHAEQQQQT